jgi:hypothetical protein
MPDISERDFEATIEQVLIQGWTGGGQPEPADAKESEMLFMRPASVGGRQTSSVLVDIGGLKVMDLRPGANDVRAPAPAVYFVRFEPSAVSREPSAVTKVIVTR